MSMHRHCALVAPRKTTFDADGGVKHRFRQVWTAAGWCPWPDGFPPHTVRFTRAEAVAMLLKYDVFARDCATVVEMEDV